MQKHHEGHGWWVLDRGFLGWCGYLSVPDRYVECSGSDTAEMEKQIHKYEFMLRIECVPAVDFGKRVSYLGLVCCTDFSF